MPDKVRIGKRKVAVRAAVATLDIDNLSPREAIDTLYRLKTLARDQQETRS